MRPRKEYLRALVALSYFSDVDLESIVDLVMFSRHLFVRRKDAFRASHIYEEGFVADSLNGSRQDFALAGNEIIKDHSALCFSDSLENYLLCGLGRDSAEISRSNLIFHHIAHFVARVDFHGFLQSNLRKIIFKILVRHNIHSHVDINVSGLFVDVNTHILRCSVVFLVSRYKRGFDGFQQNFFGYVLFLFQILDSLYKFFIHFLYYLLRILWQVSSSQPAPLEIQFFYLFHR